MDVRLDSRSTRRIAPGTPIVLTGASGWVADAFLARLQAWLEPEDIPAIRVFGSRARRISGPRGESLEVRALKDIGPADVDGAHVFHVAFLGKERLSDLAPTDYFAQNQAIDAAVERAVAASAARSVFVTSSGAAEDALSPGRRNLYGVCKLLQEDRFKALATHAPTLIGRVYNLGGPHVNKVASYALSSLVQQLLASGDAQIKASRPAFRSYLHVYDLVDLAIGWSLGGGRPSASGIDFCGAEVIEVGDIARRVAAHLHLDRARISRPPITDPTPDAYLGNSVETSLLAMRLGMGLRGFDDQIADTIQHLLTVSGASAN